MIELWEASENLKKEALKSSCPWRVVRSPSLASPRLYIKEGSPREPKSPVRDLVIRMVNHNGRLTTDN